MRGDSLMRDVLKSRKEGERPKWRKKKCMLDVVRKLGLIDRLRRVNLFEQNGRHYLY